MVVNLLAFVGALGGCTQIALWVTGSDDVGASRPYLIAVAVVGVVVVAIVTAPAAEINMSHPSFSAAIRLTSGDLFDDTSLPIVVTTNRNFDYELKHVAATSLVRQLITRWHEGSDATVRAVVPVLNGEVPVGTIVSANIDGKCAWLLAVARRHEMEGSAVVVDEIWQALTSLWGYARRNNAKIISVPVLGSGLARAQVGLVPLLMLLITSYVTATMERPACELRIVLPREMSSPEIFELARSYCEALGFRSRG